MEANTIVGFILLTILVIIFIVTWFMDRPGRYKMSSRTETILKLKSEIMACRAKGDFQTAREIKKKLEQVK